MHTNAMRAATTGANVSLFSKVDFGGKDRRKHSRIPKSIGILVHPLSGDQMESNQPFFAITRDISMGGLAYLSPQAADYNLALLALEDNPARGVVSRVCGSCLIHANEFEKVYLTSVEFLYERFL